MAGNNKRRVYNGAFPLCNKCKFHHEGSCTVRCGKCNKVGHLTRDCKATIFTTSTQRGQLKDQNCGNKTGNKSGIGEARGKAYAPGGGDANLYSNFVMGLLGHPFNIDLMPVELGSFDVIIGMDWLANHHAVIICDETIVRIPYRDEVLIVQADRITKKETKDKSEEKRLEDVPTSLFICILPLSPKPLLNESEPGIVPFGEPRRRYAMEFTTSHRKRIEASHADIDTPSPTMWPGT
ncbi:putative reverse transcriptase domain-containing protein [Tanacetum coccineum]